MSTPAHDRDPLTLGAAIRRTAAHAEPLAAIVGDAHVLRGPDVPARYVQDLWGSDRQGVASLVVRPGTAAALARVLAYCNDHKQPIVVQGGMTGLVSGGVPGPDEVVVSTERLRAVRDLDPASATVRAEAGVTLAQLQEEVGRRGLVVPIDLASKGSATVGGCVATNAGGVNVVGYGMTRQHVRSLQVALADGRLLELSTALVKDNAGYDLKQLFIGSEGTLGVVTAATLALRHKPRSAIGAFCAVRDVTAALEVLTAMRTQLPGMLSAFEVIWADAYTVLDGLELRLPLPFGHPIYILIECQGGRPASDVEAFLACLDSVSGTLLDAAVATDRAELAGLWRVREQIPIEILRMQPLFGFDVSVPGRLLEDCLDAMRAELRERWPKVRLLVFGHLGDDNVHIAVITGEVTRQRKAEVEGIVYRQVARCGGSISAEHGIGFEKRTYLSYTRVPEEVALMQALKRLLDPRGILGRGRVMPWEGDEPDD